MGITVPSLLDTTRLAILDDDHRVFVNTDAFFFSSPSERGKFLHDPLPHCGVLTDPVSHNRFRPTNRSPATNHAGRLFYFESDDTYAQFAAHPDSLSVPAMGMAPRRQPNPQPEPEPAESGT